MRALCWCAVLLLRMSACGAMCELGVRVVCVVVCGRTSSSTLSSSTLSGLQRAVREDMCPCVCEGGVRVIELKINKRVQNAPHPVPVSVSVSSFKPPPLSTQSRTLYFVMFYRRALFKCLFFIFLLFRSVNETWLLSWHYWAICVLTTSYFNVFLVIHKAYETLLFGRLKIGAVWKSERIWVEHVWYVKRIYCMDDCAYIKKRLRLTQSHSV